MVVETCPIPGCADPFSSLTHLLGAGAFAFLTPFLLLESRGDPRRVVSLAVFAFATVFLLAMSGTYHLLPHDTAERSVLQRLDHAAIFLLIAGTFTPPHVILFKGFWSWGPLLVLWGAAALGVTLKSVYFGDTPELLGVSFYLGMGWLGAVSGTLLWLRHGPRFVFPLLVGGLAYTVGAVLEFLRWPVVITGVFGPHELFHLLVLVGVALHWRFIWAFASGTLPPRRDEVCATGSPLPVEADFDLEAGPLATCTVHAVPCMLCSRTQE